MTAPDWVDGPASLQTSDSPLHAGVTLDLMRGNLHRAIEQSGYDFSSFTRSTEIMNHAFSTADTYEDMTPDIDGVPIVMRRKLDGEWRDIRVTMQAKLISGTAKATIRVHLLPAYQDALSPHSTGGITGATAYGSLESEDTSWTTLSTTITSIFDTDVGARGDSMSWVAGIPTNKVDECVLQCIATCDETTKLYVRGIRVREVTV